MSWQTGQGWPGIVTLLIAAMLPSCAHVDPLALFNRDVECPVYGPRTGNDKPSAGVSRLDSESRRMSDPGVAGVAKAPQSPVEEPRRPDTVQAAGFDEPLEVPDPNDTLTMAPAPLVPANMTLAPEPDALPAAAAPSVWTLEDLENLALANNPTLGQLAAVVDKARGIRCQVGLLPNPTVGYMGEEMGDDGTAGMQGGFISQTIVTGDKLQLNRALAGHDVETLLWELETQRIRIENDVRSQFYAALGAQERLRIARELEQVAEDGVAAAVQLERAKIVARPDILQAEIQLGEVRIIRENAEFDYTAAWKILASLVGRPELDVMPLAGTLEGATPGWSWDATYNELLANSPELQAAQARVTRAQAQIRRQEAQVIPNLQAQVGVAHNNSNGDDIATVQIGVPLPVFNRNQGNIDLACAEYRRALRDVERLRLALQARLADVFRNYQQAARQVERYQADILPKAKENLDLTTEGYRQEQFDLVRVLTARRSYFEANLAFVRSLIALRQSEVSVSGFVLSGGLNDVVDIASGSGGVENRSAALSGQ